LVTSTTTAPADTGPDEPAPGQRWRRRGPWRTRTKIWALIVAGLAVWLVGGIVQLAALPGHAAKAQTDLEAFRDAMKAGDSAAATDDLRSARGQLSRAQAGADFGPVRVAKFAPGVGDTISDLDHLLAAANLMTHAGGEALKIFDNFSGDDAKLFDNNTLDIAAITQARDSALTIQTSVDQALVELRDIHGRGPKGNVAIEKKRSALVQIGKLQSDIATLLPVMRALPSAIGVHGTKTYLVAVMNPAEMRASGGAPLSVAFLSFTNGKMTTPVQGATSDLTNTNQKTVFDKFPNDPWQTAAAQKFVNTTFNPSFPVSAEQMIRAAPSNFSGLHPDGVIALDIVAVEKLLQATGPINTAAYDTPITAENIVQMLLVNAYTEENTAANIAARHKVNDQLMSIMLSRLTNGGGLIGKVRALGGAIPSRHLQMYFRDHRLQDLVTQQQLGGQVPVPSVGNLSAVYTQNTNQSKMDVFQKRTVRETVSMKADGSAVVHRTVEIANPSPPFPGPGQDTGIGQNTRWSGSQVINLMPAGAEITQEPAAVAGKDGLTVTPMASGVDQDGRVYAQARVLLPPHATVSLHWTYVVKNAASQEGGALRLLDYVAPQSMLNPPTFELTVIPPKGWTTQLPAGWNPSLSGVAVTTPMDSSQALTVQMAPN
jgi:Protein of unknown function (DUF4012)